jgi:hypothetical protein
LAVLLSQVWRGACGCVNGDVVKQGSKFFFEKKNQKTFIDLAVFYG